MKLRKNYTCLLEIIHDIIRGKWKTIIIFQLRNGENSFSQLLHSINGISEKMLLEQLQELKEFGLIDKHSYKKYPLKVEYFLTERGKKVLNAVKIMQNVGIEYMIDNGMEKILNEKGIKYSKNTCIQKSK
ncbi:transcriptional regulator [Leptotrichia sp. OH3620_COT-345]|uniref:winged helix-turn-helix transcriptional regulator n=1 Tax=Leptotrichia sp. OH3620_COT-345 TaxID=2491048 RepID=UPI000F6502AC|nr:helix-turn-helix domain-containing protein [Leptotrichia sp. OH3620_COT-345]RRD39300.1 transcriptional regulator [Leptotrichia sp. OH3620_COT-345]